MRSSKDWREQGCWLWLLHLHDVDLHATPHKPKSHLSQWHGPCKSFKRLRDEDYLATLISESGSYMQGRSQPECFLESRFRSQGHKWQSSGSSVDLAQWSSLNWRKDRSFSQMW